MESSDLKLKNSELLAAVELGKLRVEEIQKKKDEEIRIIEEKIKFVHKKEIDMDRLRDESFYNNYKFRYMNEMARPLPGSLPSSSSSSMSPADPNFHLNASYNVNPNNNTNTPDPKAFRMLDTMNTPLQTPFSPASMMHTGLSSGLPAPYTGHSLPGLPTDSSAFSLNHLHVAIDTHKEKLTTEKARLETQMSLDKINYENKISVLETRNNTLNRLLKEANENIETLKNMLVHHRDALKHATTWEEKHSELLDDHGNLKVQHGESKKETRQAQEKIHELEVEQAHLKQVLASYRNKDVESFDHKEEIINLKVYHNYHNYYHYHHDYHYHYQGPRS